MDFDYKQEDVLEEALITDLAKAYQVHKEDLFSYLYGQYMIANIQKGRFPKVSKENRLREIGAFLIAQQGWDMADGFFHLEDTAITASVQFGSPFRNVLENLFFQSCLLDNHFLSTLEEKLKNGLLQSKKAALPYRKTEDYPVIVQAELQQRFRDSYPVCLYPDVPYPLKRRADWVSETTEERAKKERSRIEDMERNDLAISEKQLEDYLYAHLDWLEEGLRPIGRQVILPQGRIDVLARDKNNRDVIIELKVERDTDIIWQRMYYEKEWMKKNGRPRFMIVAPELDVDILDCLEECSETEYWTFTPITQKGQLVRLDKKAYKMINGKDTAYNGKRLIGIGERT